MLMIIQAAGWPVWPLLIASLVALALIVERLLSLRRSRVLPEKLLDEALRAQKSGKAGAEAVAALERNSPLGRVLAAGLRASAGGKEEMREAMEEAGAAASHELERFLTTLGTIASLAPLMGLFGTVVGMIEIFGAQNGAGADPAQLARGISIALYNTALGLAVAMPTMVFYRHFRALADRFTLEMEQQAAKFAESARAPGK